VAACSHLETICFFHAADKEVFIVIGNGNHGNLLVQEQDTKKLESVLERHRGERHIIVIQDYPDPDAISSAYAQKLISAQYDISTDIVYGGEISHQQNVALVKLLNIPLLAASDKLDLKAYQGAVLIDSQGSNTSLMQKLRAANIPLIAVIDHHAQQDQNLAAEFVDIRPVGAAATIYAGYIQSGMLELDRSHREHIAAATGLMHGILTDTNQFIHAVEPDFAAAAFLSRFADPALLVEIMNQRRSRRTMDLIQLAVQNRVIRESYSISGIGYVRATDRDAIPQAADFLLTEENVHTAIVYGIVIGEREGQRTESLVGSLRTTKLSLHPDLFIKEALGRAENGGFYGGGRSEAGGFEIPIGFLAGTGTDYDQLKWQVYDSQVKQRLFAKIGIKE
jgi:nanoRNase/pAp phosphatase (c-di-AMP/oligoRNAs hydrolase)